MPYKRLLIWGKEKIDAFLANLWAADRLLRDVFYHPIV